MRIALSQFGASSWKPDNMARIGAMTEQAAANGCGLVVFPEMAMVYLQPPQAFTEAAESLDGTFVRQLQGIASRCGICIVVGMLEAIPQEPRVYNTIVAIDSTGRLLGVYRKMHLFDAFGHRESDRIRPGNGETLTFKIAALTFGVQTCYDLRFPEMSRRLIDQGTDVLLVPSAWVAGPLKESQWETLLRARAIENTAYVAGVDQVGGKYCGRSMFIDPMGVAAAVAPEHQSILTGVVDAERIAGVRRKVPSLTNRRFDAYAVWERTRDKPIEDGNPA